MRSVFQQNRVIVTPDDNRLQARVATQTDPLIILFHIEKLITSKKNIPSIHTVWE